MMKLLAYTAGAALLAAANPILAQVPASDMPAGPAAKPAKPKRICRRQVDTGSIMPTRVCHTAEEWTIIDGNNKAATEQARDPRGRYGGFGGPQ